MQSQKKKQKDRLYVCKFFFLSFQKKKAKTKKADYVIM